MGLFGCIGDLASAAIKVAATPIAVVSDVVNVATGNEVNSTEKLIESTGESLSDAVDEIMP